ncbi:hypothetical protein V1514DRAFT_179085 [Lipomyces japonicus]|uniref:uncharacterized protein n=1 Tax=Lipomyces japonicus TaxID=56871 RepID=UPI0034CD2EE8
MESRWPILLGVFISFTILALIAITLRVYSRRQILHNFGLDDYFMVAGFIFFLALIITSLVGFRYDSTVHQWDARPDTLNGRLRFGYAMAMLYVITLFLVKMSILIFYTHISPSPAFLCVTRSFMVFVSLHCLAFMLGMTLVCDPPQDQWNVTSHDNCGNFEVLYFVQSSINIFSDFFILILPIPIVHKVRVPLRKKINLCVLFSIGSVAAIASVVRLYYVYQFFNAADQTWHGSNLPMWSVIECSIAITTASVPAIRPLWLRWHGRMTGRLHCLPSLSVPTGSQVESSISDGESCSRSHAQQECPVESSLADITSTVVAYHNLQDALPHNCNEHDRPGLVSLDAPIKRQSMESIMV